MIVGIVGQHIARSTRNLLWVNGLLLLGLAVMWALAGNYVYNCLTGPFPIDSLDLPAVRPADPRHFFRAEFDLQHISPRYLEASGGKDGAAGCYFVLLLGNRRAMLIARDDKTLTPAVDGSLQDIPSRIREYFANDQDFRQLQLVPLMFDGRGYRTGFYVMLGVTLAVGGLAAWNLWRGWKRRGNPALHPAAKVLALYGVPEEIAVAIDAEYQAGAERIGQLAFTQSWLLSPNFFGLDLMYLGDVVWAYPKQVKTKAYGVVTVNTTHAMVLHDRHGRQLELTLSEARVKQLLARILQLVPWVVAGYSDQLAAIWQRQRGEFFKAVEERKQQHLASPTDPGTADSAPQPTPTA